MIHWRVLLAWSPTIAEQREGVTALRAGRQGHCLPTVSSWGRDAKVLPHRPKHLLTPRYRCIYCTILFLYQPADSRPRFLAYSHCTGDTFLTHDSKSVRTSHINGWKHKASVKNWFEQFMANESQELINERIRNFEARLAGAGVDYGSTSHSILQPTHFPSRWRWI